MQRRKTIEEEKESKKQKTLTEKPKDTWPNKNRTYILYRFSHLLFMLLLSLASSYLSLMFPLYEEEEKINLKVS